MKKLVNKIKDEYKIISNENNIYPEDNDSESLNESNGSNNDRL